MRLAAGFVTMMMICSFAVAQKAADFESVSMRILKIERTQEEVEGGGLWWIIKITAKDDQGIMYKASSKCTPINADSPLSCDRLALPRIGKTVTTKVYPEVGLLYFSESAIGSVSFQINSEEVSEQHP